MPTTINVSVDVPATYRVDLLTQQLTEYARRLVASAESKSARKQRYRHEALCGIFDSKATKEELLEEYLQDKYDL